MNGRIGWISVLMGLLVVAAVVADDPAGIVCFLGRQNARLLPFAKDNQWYYELC